MRLADIAKELRITTQELRRELTKTNFGISTTAHEVDDALAKGVIRFLKGKVKPTLTHKRTAVVFKDEKEVKPKKKKIVRKKPAEKEGEAKDKEKEAPPEGEGKTIIVKSRAAVPKSVPTAGEGESAHVTVSRRIEVDRKSADLPAENLPKTYYKSKGKRKGKKVKTEERILTMMRHPHTGRKTKVARVNYAVGEEEGLTAEELAIEREIDRERFREQKKNRAVGQKRITKAQPQIKAKTGVIEIPSVISVKEFSEKCGLPVADVMANLLKNGIMATINQKLDYETAAVVAADLGMEVKMSEKQATSEELFAGDIKALLQEEDKSTLKERPPIVTVMGHVDHGKTRLLDTIRNTNVIAGESGGITQHIGAYQVEKNGHPITFLDTPGHEAFTAMRARGAKVTDIAILVVAADEGVKPQTAEAINHAKEAGVPIIVAINKIDKPNANIDKVKGELVEYELQAEDWGGKTIMVPVSAHTGEGIDDLLEMILLVAEMENIRANPRRMAVGTVVESHLNPSLGPVATILINTGTLRVGDMVVVGNTMGRVKTMHDDKGQNLKKVLPSGAARISGLNKVPKAGDILQAFKDEKIAKERLNQLTELRRQQEEGESGSMVERIVSQINTGDINYLKLVVKADTKGSLEAILQALNKIKNEDVAVKVIHCGVGNISDTDVVMASASQALLVGFHVVANVHVRKLAEKEHVDIKNYTIIYKLTEDVRAILSGMLEPEINVVELGEMVIKQIFLDKKKWAIIGCAVKKGKVTSHSMVRVTRDGETLFEAEIESLKHVAQDVTELEKGSECGIRIKTPQPVQEGDKLEVFKIEKKERTL
ncbi:translation initiation factor IF-2 [Candidatus Peregrinibacteria bacterium]|nr:translation initiation factor IF-2 [Candidatus Peregrinibacteria bacterium]